jgi:hypothetical protein
LVRRPTPTLQWKGSAYKKRRAMYIATSDTAYTGWQPVRIDAGYGGSSSRGDGDGFFTNSTGLQWSSNAGVDPAADSFGGWIICDWWHGTEPGLLHSTIRANHIHSRERRRTTTLLPLVFL